MTRSFYVSFMLMTASVTAAHAQSGWTLDRCIDYAMQHNTQLMQSRLQVEDAQLQLHTTRFSRLPNLNAYAGQSFGFGRSTGRNGTTEDVTSTSTSFGINTSVPVFTAFRLPNQIKAERESLMSAQQQVEVQKRNLGISVTTYYLNSLYYQGMVDVRRQQVASDSLLLEQARVFVSEGSKAESEVLEAEAALASSRVQLTTALGQYRTTLLDLMQAINYEDEDVPAVGPSAMALAPVPLSQAESDAMQARLLATDNWVCGAIEQHPSLLSARHQLRGSQYTLAATRATFFPTLDLSAGYGTSAYHIFNNAMANQPFGRQLNLNGSENVSLSLNIPIFNRFATRNSVKRAELNIENQRMQVDETRRNLAKQVQQARTDALNAAERLRSAEVAERACATAFDYEREKYVAGRSTLYNLGQAQQKLTAARGDALQARLELQLRLLLLAYYE